MIRRRQYMDMIAREWDKPVVKILTGVKRAGKTTLFQILQDDLTSKGVSKKNIVSLSFEGLENQTIPDYQSLYDAVSEKAVQGERTYVFLDEPQRVHGWEKAVLHLMHDIEADFYVSGSNNTIVSPGVLAVFEDKHHITEILPLSFEEYLQFREEYTTPEDAPRELVRYLMTGSFPALHRRLHTQTEAYTYVRDVLNAALWTDIAGLGQLRRTDQFERVMRFVFMNIGNSFSVKYLTDTLKNENKEINIETVYTYLERLENAFLVYRCRRFDLNTDEPLKTQEKYYLSDPALCYASMGFKTDSVTAGLENIVYLELRRRGFEVYMGKLGRREIDFVGINQNRRVYVQLSRDLRGGEGSDYARLNAIRDNYPKFILTMDNNAVGNRNGIQTVYITDFLLGRTSY